MRHLQSLEQRRLLSAALDGKVIRITGTGGDDRIRVFGGDNQQIIVRVNDEEHRFALADASRLSVEAFRGDDDVEISQKLRLDTAIRGAAGADTIVGGGGDDLILGGTGGDEIHGGAGNDTLDGDWGDDLINGWEGNDLLIGRYDHDLLSGGPGIDTADYGWVAAPTTEASIRGDSRLSVRPIGILAVLHEDQRVYSKNSTDEIGGDVEAIDGTKYRDIMIGNSAGQIFRGRGGPDILHGSGGDDTLIGDEGTDHLYGENGNDWIDAGDGDDSIYAGNGNDYVLAGAGRDLVEGNAGDDSIQGSAGDDLIYGNAGRDTLNGGAGKDTVFDRENDTKRAVESVLN